MRLSLNSEYAKRHVLVGVLFVALSIWSIWDGAVSWPAANAKWERENGRTVESVLLARAIGEFLPENENPPHWPRQIDYQFYQAAFLGLLAVYVLVGVWRCRKATLEFDGRTFRGSLVNGEELSIDDIKAVDWKQWKKKGIVKVGFANGTAMVLDSWHHLGVKEIAASLPKFSEE